MNVSSVSIANEVKSLSSTTNEIKPGIKTKTADLRMTKAHYLRVFFNLIIKSIAKSLIFGVLEQNQY